MKKISLVVHQKYIDDIIKRLHDTGLMEILNISKTEGDEAEFYEKASSHNEASVVSNYFLRLSRLIDILNKIKVKPSGIKSLLNPELPEVKTIPERSLDELYSYTESVLAGIEKSILKKDETLKQLDEDHQNITNNLEQIKYLKDFDMDLSDIGESEYLIIKAGTIENIDNLKNALNNVENSTYFSKKFGSGKEIIWSVIIAAYKKEKEKIEKICREHITEFTISIITGTPKKISQDLDNDLKKIEQEKKKHKKELRKYVKDQLSELLALREEIKLELVRKEISLNFTKTNTTYIIKGWCLEKNENNLKTVIEKSSNGYAIFESEVPSSNPDDPPTFFNTPKWAKGFESLLGMFASPRYNEVNPTIIMGLFFVFFFGVMLGDAGYGLIILILSILGYIKLSKASGIFSSFTIMGIMMGIITTIVGFLTNSFFGDLIPRFFYGDETLPLYSLDLFGIHFPVNPLNDPLSILSLALIFGLIHLNVGVFLGIYQEFKRKNYKSMMTEKFCWIPLQLGGGMLIGYFILDWYLPTFLFYIAGIMVVVGLILLFIASGPVGFFDITGYVGDWLSYARLLALGLATAGMALAFNVVSGLLNDMIPIQIIGMIIMIILLVILHIVNLGLQALGAAVHSLRLQYVEFFNRFYQGGGREFSPFKIKRKYTKLDGEKID